MFYNRSKILILSLMTTFYMNGCVPDKDSAIDYFELRFFTIEELVDKDNDFQLILEEIVTSNINDSLLEDAEFDNNLQLLKARIDSLKDFVEKQKQVQWLEEENDENLNRAFLSILQAYSEVVSEQYKTMIYLIEQEENNQVFSVEFKNNYETATQKLEDRLSVFYTSVQHFGEKNEIPINFEE